MKNKVLIRVLVAIVLAIIAGLISGPNAAIFGVTFVRLFGLLGQLFLNALTLVVVPLVGSSIIIGSAKMGFQNSFRALGGKTLGYFLLTTLLAAAVGLVVALVISPGISNNSALLSHLAPDNIPALESQSQGDGFHKIEQLALKIIPSNILAVASQGQMLGLIFFSLLFGFFISRIEEPSSTIVLGFFQGVFQIMMKITHLFMIALPFGVFGLVAKVVATTGFDAVKPVMLFSATVLCGLFIYGAMILPLLIKFIAGISPLAHFRAMGPALLTAFSTSSSAATLPVTIECVEKRVGISNRICSFVIPLGTSMNVSGTALYQCVASIFIAQVYGIDLSVVTLLTIAIMSMITSMGMAGIPSASLISIVMILHAIGIPAEGIGLILATERILDMCRTTVTVFGNSCCAVLVARSEGENQLLVNSLARV
jgi:proton glutamate symport protein